MANNLSVVGKLLPVPLFRSFANASRATMLPPHLEFSDRFHLSNNA